MFVLIVISFIPSMFVFSLTHKKKSSTVFILWSYLLYLRSLRSLSRSLVQGCGLHASYNSSHLFIVCIFFSLFFVAQFSRRLQRSQFMTQFIHFGLVRVFVVFLFLLSYADTHPNMTFWMATMWTRGFFWLVYC